MNYKESHDICVYFHINPIKNEVFYVGIGDKNRPKEKDNRSIFWNNTVKKYGYEIKIVHTNLSWEKACDLEKFYIKTFGRKDLGTGSLVNLTDGGEGAQGRKHSEETKLKISNSHFGIKHSDAAKEKISQFNKGRKQSQETINKRVEKLKGRIVSNETREKIRISNIGKIKSEEQKRKQSESCKGRKHSKETIEKFRLKNIGKKMSEEVKTKISNFNKKKVIQMDLQENFIKEWDCAIDIEKELNIGRMNIGACCRGITKTCSGFKWKYIY